MSDPIKKSKHHDLPHRILVNGVSAGLIALFIFFAQYHPLRWVFAIAVAACAAVALWEYYQLVKKKEADPAILLGLASTVLYIFAVFYKSQGPHMFWEPLWKYAPEIILGAAFFGCFVFFALTRSSPIVNISTTFLGILYIGIPLGIFIRIMYFFTYGMSSDPHLQGSWWIIYLIAVTKSADMGGYFIGRFFGKHKLAFKLSPNKTLEGAIGGLAASMLISLFICWLGKQFGHVFEAFTYFDSIWLGVLIGMMGQAGDLAESLLKRDAKVKDSNHIPGVGGLLDMVDSLLFTAPVLYIFLRIIYTGLP